MTTLLLVDISAIYWARWHMLSPTEDASAPHDATVRAVFALAAHYDCVTICCDAPTNWRKQLYPPYKHSRAERPSFSFVQLDRCKDTLRADGFNVIQCDGFEADDLIATITTQALAHNQEEGDPSTGDNMFSVFIATSDKDLYQLLGPNVRIVPTMLERDGTEKALVDIEACTKKFGVPPKALGDWLALTGDKSDDVPGIPGIGDKTATKLLMDFYDLDGVFAAALDVKNKFTPLQRARLTDGEKQCRLSRELVRLRTDAPVRLGDALLPRQSKTENDDHTDYFSDEEKEDDVEQQTETEAAPAAAPEATQQAAPAAPAPPAPKASSVDDTLARLMEYMPKPGTDEWALFLEPRTPRQCHDLALAIFKSKLFDFVNAEQAMAAIMLGRSLGIGAITVCRNVHMIKGKMSLSATLIVGLCLKSTKCEYFDCLETSNEQALYVTRRRGSPHEIKLAYTMEDAKMCGALRATKSGEPSQWQTRPRTMLRHRCSTELARMVFPDIVSGVYAPEELVEAYEDLPASYTRQPTELVDAKQVEREADGWIAGRT